MLIHVFLLMKNPRERQNHKCTHFNIINIIWLPLCSPRCPGFYLPVAAEEESQDHFYIPAQEVTLVRCQLGKRARAQACKRKQELHQEIPVFLHRKRAPSDTEPARGERHAQTGLYRASSTAQSHQCPQPQPLPRAASTGVRRQRRGLTPHCPPALALRLCALGGRGQYSLEATSHLLVFNMTRSGLAGSNIQLTLSIHLFISLARKRLFSAFSRREIIRQLKLKL